jgi:hypothetical protein
MDRGSVAHCPALIKFPSVGPATEPTTPSALVTTDEGVDGRTDHLGCGVWAYGQVRAYGDIAI